MRDSVGVEGRGRVGWVGEVKSVGVRCVFIRPLRVRVWEGTPIRSGVGSSV